MGAGIGETARLLCGAGQHQWVALEPDAALVQRRKWDLPSACEFRVGTMGTLAPSVKFSSILYIDVLEHIQDDRSEMERAAAHLAPGGHLVVLSPAHQFLYTPFDAAIGHCRRYSRQSLLAAAPPHLELVSMRYLDSVGMLASLGNKLVLGSSMPTAAQIKLWDSWMVPCSRLVDPVFGYRLGKSILGIWRRNEKRPWS